MGAEVAEGRAVRAPGPSHRGFPGPCGEALAGTAPQGVGRGAGEARPSLAGKGFPLSLWHMGAPVHTG